MRIVATYFDLHGFQLIKGRGVNANQKGHRGHAIFENGPGEHRNVDVLREALTH
jgi:hypothetical protein